MDQFHLQWRCSIRDGANILDDVDEDVDLVVFKIWNALKICDALFKIWILTRIKVQVDEDVIQANENSIELDFNWIGLDVD